MHAPVQQVLRRRLHCVHLCACNLYLLLRELMFVDIVWSGYSIYGCGKVLTLQRVCCRFCVSTDAARIKAASTNAVDLEAEGH